MNDDEPQPAEPDAPPGVFGNLPGSRPGTRSPRRDQAAGSRRAAEPAGGRARPEPEPHTAAAGPEGPRAAGEQTDPTAGEPEAPQAAEESGDGGLEDLAWAGVAAAAEAATLGVRLASRAMEALRETVDRR